MACMAGDNQGNIRIELTMGSLADEQTGDDAENPGQARGIYSPSMN